MKASDYVISLEREHEHLKKQLEEAAQRGKTQALRYLNYKTNGFIDGAARILQKYGISGPDSYAIADEFWDLVKESAK